MEKKPLKRKIDEVDAIDIKEPKKPKTAQTTAFSIFSNKQISLPWLKKTTETSEKTKFSFTNKCTFSFDKTSEGAPDSLFNPAKNPFSPLPDSEKLEDAKKTEEKRPFSPTPHKAGDTSDETICDIPKMKLFVLEETNGNKKNWKERGVGTLNLNWIDKTAKSARLISRREHVHTLLLNANPNACTVEKLEKSAKHFQIFVTNENNNLQTYLVQTKPQSVSRFVKEFRNLKAELGERKPQKKETSPARPVPSLGPEPTVKTQEEKPEAAARKEAKTKTQEEKPEAAKRKEAKTKTQEKK